MRKRIPKKKKIKDKFFKFSLPQKIDIVGLISLIISFIALIISFGAFITSNNVAYGGSNLEIEYAIGDQEFFYWYDNTSIGYEFIVENRGFGSTVYATEPGACSKKITCMPENSSMVVRIKYNDEDFKQIYHPDIKSIEPKSSHIVMVIIENITQADMPEYIEVLVRDLRTNEHLWKMFKKAPLSQDVTNRLVNPTPN